jgi:pyruvate/2-oxoglutarate dehydrogenase complex dihydrolipoamide dehydrogenase (E3) component
MMSVPEHYHMLVLGSGEGGKYLAWHMARSGHRTAVVERKLIGGSCPNTNCLPSKNEIWSAKVADMVNGLIDMHLDLYKKTGAELIMGSGRLLAPKTVEVSLNDGGTRTLTADRLVLNVGTHATIPDIPGLSPAAPLTNVEALELDRAPNHLIVLGGGYVGLELAQAYRRFGSAVSIIESGPQFASREDPDVAAAILDVMRDEGITVYLSARILGVRGRSGEGVNVQFSTPAGDHMIEGSDILVATGRAPNTDGIGLDRAGVALEANGYIVVNDRLETSAPDVWAIGECAGSPQFTHVSFDAFRVIRGNLAGGDLSARDRLVPYCMFTDPPLARVGLSESEAQRKGIAIRLAKLPIIAVLRSRTISETRDFMKAVVAGASDRILGFTMIGAEAGEVMAVVQTAMLAGMPFTGLRDAIFAHPTMAEGLGPGARPWARPAVLECASPIKTGEVVPGCRRTPRPRSSTEHVGRRCLPAPAQRSQTQKAAAQECDGRRFRNCISRHQTLAAIERDQGDIVAVIASRICHVGADEIRQRDVAVVAEPGVLVGPNRKLNGGREIIEVCRGGRAIQDGIAVGDQPGDLGDLCRGQGIAIAVSKHRACAKRQALATADKIIVKQVDAPCINGPDAGGQHLPPDIARTRYRTINREGILIRQFDVIDREVCRRGRGVECRQGDSCSGKNGGDQTTHGDFSLRYGAS